MHRDIKPDNIMVCGPGEAAHHATAVLIDFGLARRTDGQDDEDDGGGGEVSPGGTLTLTLASTLTLTPTLTPTPTPTLTLTRHRDRGGRAWTCREASVPA